MSILPNADGIVEERYAICSNEIIGLRKRGETKPVALVGSRSSLLGRVVDKDVPMVETFAPV